MCSVFDTNDTGGIIMITYAMFSDKGDRELNEDFIGMKEKSGTYIFALADGLGGHGRGEVASKLVVEEALAEFSEQSVNGDLIDNIFEKCQGKLMNNQKELHATNEMKTTLVVGCVTNDGIRWGHIGDSRLYLFQGKKLICRTVDHSVPQMLVFAGEIKEKDIRFHPDRNRLMKVMGTEWVKPEYELSTMYNRSGRQAFLLCSDGFWELIDEKKMIKCLKKASSVQEWLDLMLRIVYENGKGKDMDNFSAICVWCD